MCIGILCKNLVFFSADLDVLQCFISAIFYVGKGKRARPYCHLYEAIKHMQKPKDKVCQIILMTPFKECTDIVFGMDGISVSIAFCLHFTL